jgi:hypothetical protein
MSRRGPWNGEEGRTLYVLDNHITGQGPVTIAVAVIAGTRAVTLSTEQAREVIDRIAEILNTKENE